MNADAPRAAWRVLLWPGLFTAVALAILLGLGFWQVERLGAKERFAARIAASLAGAPQSLAPEKDWPTLKEKVTDYTKVTLQGTFVHDKETYLYGVITQGRDSVPGLFVFTPLRLADGAIVFVNRGFIPNDKRDPKARAEGQVGGVVTINGVLRTPQPRGMFTPTDDLKNGLWFTRDPAGFAAAAGLQRVAPFTVDADATAVPGGWPKGGYTVVSFPNNHLQYAITWFLLAFCVAGFFIFWARRLLAEERNRATLVTAPRGP